MEKTRYRVKFAKTEAMRYTGHLDLHRSLERTFRRADLPLLYSKGYNPRARINLASALPLGFTSQAEIADVWLEEELDPVQIKKALVSALPPGLHILGIEQVDLQAATLQTILQSAEFTITFLEPILELEESLAALLSKESIMRERRGKSYDLRPMIEDAKTLTLDDNGNQRISLRLSARAGATGRPEEVIAAIGLSQQSTRVQRENLIFLEKEE